MVSAIASTPPAASIAFAASFDSAARIREMT
jgi:hypothetical protein